MARILDQIRGHQKVIQSLIKAAEKQSLAHAMLFVGPSGVGKKRVAYGLVQALTCRESPFGCGNCPSCLRVEAGQSENLLYIEPEGLNVKIDQARDAIRFVSLQQVGKARVVIIDSAHQMNPQAGNALLKALEEPPSNTYFILLAPSLGNILTTIRSRCQIIRFASLSVSDLRAISGAENWVLDSCQGRLDLLEQMNDPEWAEVREKAYSILVRVWEGEVYDLSSRLRDLCKDKKTALFTVHCWQSFFRDAIFHRLGLNPIINQDHTDIIEKVSYTDLSDLYQTSEQCIGLEKDIGGNLDKLLAFENFWMQQPAVEVTA